MLKQKKVSDKPVEKVFEVRQNLKVKLTTEEILKAGEALAEAVQRGISLEEEKKSVMDSYKAKLSEAEAQIGVQKNLVSNKWEFRPVPCNEIHNFEQGTVKIVRLDTNETINNRAMTAEERQGNLPFEDVV